MSDWATMKQDLLRDLHFDTTTSGSNADNDVSRAIIDSIKFNRRYDFGFTRGKADIYTISDQFEYPLPEGFLGITGDVWSTPSLDTTGRYTLKNRPIDWMEKNRYRVNGQDRTLNTGDVGYYGINVATKSIVLSPVPSDDGTLIEFYYHYDPGTPDFVYTGSAWAFYDPGTTNAISGTYSNAWFTDAYRLTFNRAAYYLLTGAYGGTEEAAMKAQQYMQQWSEELNRLRGDFAKYVGNREIRRYL